MRAVHYSETKFCKNYTWIQTRNIIIDINTPKIYNISVKKHVTTFDLLKKISKFDRTKQNFFPEVKTNERPTAILGTITSYLLRGNEFQDKTNIYLRNRRKLGE